MGGNVGQPGRRFGASGDEQRLRKVRELAMAIEKIVCFDCATEPYLHRQIQRKGTSAPCSLCGNKRKCVPLSQITAQVDRLLYASQDSGEREFALAWCSQFNNRNMVSMAKQFGVSDSAMAFRIRELELVRWP